MTTQQKRSESRALPSAPDRLTRIARRLVPIYIGALVLAAPVVLGMFGYGLAHASDGAIFGLLAMLAGLFALAALPPLVLLSQSNSPAIKALKVIGGLVMLAGIAGMLKLLNFWLLEPEWMKMKFRHAMGTIEVVKVEEQPIELAGQVIGLRIIREVDLQRATTLDQYGHGVFNAIQNVYIAPVNPPPNALPPFDGQVKSTLLTIDGRAVSTTFAELAGASEATTLQAGRYRVEHIILLWGLRAREWPAQPCRDEDSVTREMLSRGQVSGYALEIGSLVQFSLGSRRGYPTYSLAKLPIKYRYEHAVWMQGLAQLPIDTCAQRDARELAAKAEALRVQNEKWYEAGDSRLSSEDNPLFLEICNNDLDAVAARLARGVPKYNISGKIFECTLNTQRLEMFALAMPALRARAQEREGYCNVLSGIHRRRALPYLEKLAALGLPILCTQQEDDLQDYQKSSCASSARPDLCRARYAKGADAWRGGLYPVDDKGQDDVNQGPAARADTVRWLQFLRAQAVPICRTLPDGTNLLQDVVARFPPEVVQFLATAGCDPHVNPPFVADQWPLSSTDASAAVHWFLRRNNFNLTLYDYTPIDPEQGRLVAAAMGDLTATEINHADPTTGASLLHKLARSMPDRLDALRYLLAHGAHLDVADKEGKSWFGTDYLQMYGPGNTTAERQRQLFAMLDQFSVAQLRELMLPKNSLTGEPGVPIEEYDFAPGQLTAYLCRRGAKQCR